MILRSIELESFGKFRGHVVDFRRGMNLVIGPNEAGKSTIAEAIPAVLFGTDRLERFKPWGRNSCLATLFFEGQGRTVQIKRNLITDEVELVEKDDLYHVLSEFSGKVPLRGRSASCREYRTLLESLIGVADEKLFRATYFFGHHPQEWSGEELAQKLRTLVSGSAETDYAEILDNLLEEHFQLTRDNPWGRDKQRDREYEEICQRITNENEMAEPDSVPVFVEIDNNAEIKAQLEKLGVELDEDRKEHAKGLRYIERIRDLVTEAADRSSRNDVAGEPEKSQPPVVEGSLAEQIAAVGLPRNPPRELPELLAEAGEIRQKLAALQQPFSALNNREKKIPVVPWLALSGLVVLMVAVCALAWWQAFYFMQIALVSGVCSLLLFGLAGWREINRKKALAECHKERDLLEQKKLLEQNRQAELSERCSILGLPTSAIDLVRVQKLVSLHRELLERFWQQGDPLATSLDEAPKEQKVEQEIAEPVESAEVDHDLPRLEARIADFEGELQAKEQRLRELQLQLKDVNQSLPPGATAPGSALQQRKFELEGRIRLLRKAIDLLAAAVDAFSQSHLTLLNDAASKLFNKITNGRYSAIKLDENMAPSIQVDGRRWLPVENFSRGTVDAIYLALRIALAKVRDDGRSLPLMLDDPFVHLDQKRLATTLNQIDLASADGQLILFSHNQELGKRAARERWHVVPLDGDAVADRAEEGGEHVGQLHLL